MAEKRFVETYAQGVMDTRRIIVDTQTGVNYLLASAGETGGLCVLVDANGKPIVTHPDPTRA